MPTYKLLETHERNIDMGMSASQARFLSLTARKNNVEFEGQQINQQRTCLSNESASYYSELCNMAVPTPPSIDDYTKVTYTFSDGAMTNTIMSILPDKTDKTKYNISYVESWQDDYAIVPSASSMVQKNGTGSAATYSIGGTFLRNLGEIDGSEKEVINVGGVEYEVKRDPGTNQPYYDSGSLSAYEKDMLMWFDTDSAGNITNAYYKGSDGRFYNVDDITESSPISGFNESAHYISTEDESGTTFMVQKDPSTGEYQKLDSDGNPITARTDITDESQIQKKFTAGGPVEDDEYLKTLTEDQLSKLKTTEDYYLAMLREKFGDDSENFRVRYVKNTTTGSWEPQFFSNSEVENASKYNNKNLASVPCYSLGSITQSREVLGQSGRIEKDSSGRYVAITLELKDGNNNTIERTYSLTTTTTTDEGAYNDAMNQYTYKQHEYEHRIQEINSKLEIIQQQDKQLELKLKQLDTEENAISTELDAVKKVISKNVDSSFKTFG